METPQRVYENNWENTKMFVQVRKKMTKKINPEMTVENRYKMAQKMGQICIYITLEKTKNSSKIVLILPKND